MRSAERRKVNVLETKCLTSWVGVSRMDTVNNEEVHWRARIEMELASRADQRILRLFGHVERMDEYRMARRVLMAEVSGGRVRGRPRFGWMDGVKVALGNRGIMAEAARQSAKDRREWRALEPWSPFLLGTVFFRAALQCSSDNYMERGGIPLYDAVGLNRKKGGNY